MRSARVSSQNAVAAKRGLSQVTGLHFGTSHGFSSFSLHWFTVSTAKLTVPQLLLVQKKVVVVLSGGGGKSGGGKKSGGGRAAGGGHSSISSPQPAGTLLRT